LLKIPTYKTKQIHIWQRHLRSLSPLLHISAHLCHPHRYHRPNLKIPKTLQITTLILILCSFQQPNSKGRVAGIHKHIWLQYIIKLLTFAVDVKIYKKKSCHWLHEIHGIYYRDMICNWLKPAPHLYFVIAKPSNSHSTRITHMSSFNKSSDIFPCSSTIHRGFILQALKKTSLNLQISFVMIVYSLPQISSVSRLIN